MCDTRRVCGDGMRPHCIRPRKRSKYCIFFVELNARTSFERLCTACALLQRPAHFFKDLCTSSKTCALLRRHAHFFEDLRTSPKTCALLRRPAHFFEDLRTSPKTCALLQRPAHFFTGLSLPPYLRPIFHDESISRLR